MRRIVLVSGSSVPELGSAISSKLDIALVDPNLKKFANGEIHCEIGQNVRGADVFLIQSLCHPINDTLMELLIMIDALKRASAESITAVLPHYGYARQDRKVGPRTPITAKLVADLITVAGAGRVMTMDLHAGQIQGFFNIPFDNIYATPVILGGIEKHLQTKNIICVSPDAGGVERVRHYAKKLGKDLAMIDKRRTGTNVAKAMNVVGDVAGKDAVIIDDIIDTAGTLVQAALALEKKGAKSVHAFATHGIFSAPALERISNCDALKKVFVTDTIPLSAEGRENPKVEILSTAEILAWAIQRTFNHDSVSSLFT